MKEIFEIAFAIILSIGSGGALVYGISSWFGKIWASKILEKEKNKYAKEIEKYKAQLEKEILNLNLLNEKAIFVTKLQYEKEFSIYLELWEDLVECTRRTLVLYPFIDEVPSDEVELEELKRNRHTKFVEAFNQFMNSKIKYAPFYNVTFDELLENILKDCSEIGTIFKRYNFDVKYSASYASVRHLTITIEEEKKVYKTLPDTINSNQEKLKNEIRLYLKKLQIGQNHV